MDYSQIILEVALLWVLVFAIFFAVQSMRRAKRLEVMSTELEELRDASQATIESLNQQLVSAQAAIERLARWEGIADADERAATLLRDAEAAAAAMKAAAAEQEARAQEQAGAIRSAAAEEAAALKKAAADRAKAANADADALLADARARADSILAAANARADEVAGDALRALRDAEQLEQAVRAMKNTLEGYGDEYLIPSHTLIDALADDFAHEQAGQKLKLIRDEVRRIVRAGRAATCDYVEEIRRETAIRFVVDAFDGKVDMALARVRDDNAGKLEQEIRDAFALVNLNGRAFRNARITEEFLSLRLEELRWAATVQALKVQEREEQRRIREQIREEEKARREYERAIRDAAKDEEVARRAMEKAQQQLAKASDEQKAKYEAQLRELEERLREAERRNERALSMAQQTRRGHVYIISNVGSLGENVYKIGLTRRLEPMDRIRELGDSSVPFEFDVHAMIFAEDAPALEHQLHRHFVLSQVNKVNPRKEFFRVDLSHIREEIEKLGLATHWTMVAKAEEYRESQRIETIIRENPAAREAWIRRQMEVDLLPGFAGENEGEDDGVGGARDGQDLSGTRSGLGG